MELLAIVILVLMGLSMVLMFDLFEKEVLDAKERGKYLGTYYEQDETTLYEYIVYSKVVDIIEYERVA